MLNEIGIDIGAPARTVFDLARDIERWPQRLPHYRHVTVRSRSAGRVTATFSATRPLGPLGIPVWWRAEQWSDDTDAADLKLNFRHVGGATKGMVVTWHIRPSRVGCRVTIEHDFARRILLLPPNFFPAVVDRLFVRPIAGRTLATFKVLAESVATAVPRAA